MTGNSEDVVGAFFQALGEREVEAAESLLGEDAGFHIPAAGPAVAEGGRAFVGGDLIAAFPDLQIEIRNSFTDGGDKVVMELTMAGTQGGENHWGGIVAQGKHFSVDQAWLVDVAGG